MLSPRPDPTILISYVSLHALVLTKIADMFFALSSGPASQVWLPPTWPGTSADARLRLTRTACHIDLCQVCRQLE